MGINTNKRSTIGNLNITGSSTAAGGLYDRVKIVGEGIIEGDIACRHLQMYRHLRYGR